MSAKEDVENRDDIFGLLNRIPLSPVWPVRHGSEDCPKSGWLPTSAESVQSARDRLGASPPFLISTAKINEILPGATLLPSAAG